MAREWKQLYARRERNNAVCYESLCVPESLAVIRFINNNRN